MNNQYECVSCTARYSIPSEQDTKSLVCGCGKPLRLVSMEFPKDKDEEQANEELKLKELKTEYVRLVYGKHPNLPDASELIVNYIKENNHIYTTKDDLKSEMWIYKEGIYVPQGKSEIKELVRRILEEHFTAFICNIILNKIEADTYIDADVFFKNNSLYELPVVNGILNIQTKELSEFNPKKVFFNKLPVRYDPSKECPKIEEFLSEVLSCPEDRQVIYEIGGYGLLKDSRFEKAFILVGNGRNGKGKTIELLQKVIGFQNCSAVPLSALREDSFQVSELFGKMLNLAGDIGNKDLQETGLFKSLTGRDSVSVKRKFLRDLHFQNYSKFVFACNNLPMVYDLSQGFWERWVLLEFPYYFADKEEYDSAPEHLRVNWKVRNENKIDEITTEDELSGLLNKFLSALDDLIVRKKFSSTKGSEEIKNTWIRKSNSFIAFAIDKLEESYDSHITKKELRKEYAGYCKVHKVMPKSDLVIKKVLQDTFGASDERIMIGVYPNNELLWVWQGVKWK